MTDEKIKLVKMVRGEKTADVHPLEVENYKIGGWKIVIEDKEEKPPAPKQAAKKGK